MHARQTPEIATISHISKNTGNGMRWEFKPATSDDPAIIQCRVLIAHAGPVDIQVPVCSHRKPIPGAWVMIRRSEDGWLLTSARMPRDSNDLAKSERFDDDLPVGSITLSDAPEETSVRISEDLDI